MGTGTGAGPAGSLPGEVQDPRGAEPGAGIERRQPSDDFDKAVNGITKSTEGLHCTVIGALDRMERPHASVEMYE